MANAKKCDICGKLYELYNTSIDCFEPNFVALLSLDSHGFEDGKYSSMHRPLELDCCPNCMKSIHDHIESLKPVAEEG